MNNNEEWKTFFENYEISNHGHMRRELVNGSYKYIEGYMNKKGYKITHITRNYHSKTFMFHQQVVYQFIGPRPEGLVIDHIDRNKLNNHVSNLRYCSNKENIRNTDTFRDDILEQDKNKRNRILNRESSIRRGVNKLINRLKYTGTIQERNKKFTGTVVINKKSYSKTCSTKEECEEFFNEMRDPEKRSLHKTTKGCGHIKERYGRFTAMISFQNKNYIKTFDTREECKAFFEKMRNVDCREAFEPFKKSGCIKQESNGKYLARTNIKGKSYCKTLPTKEEAEDFIKQMKELHL